MITKQSNQLCPACRGMMLVEVRPGWTVPCKCRHGSIAGQFLDSLQLKAPLREFVETGLDKSTKYGRKVWGLISAESLEANNIFILSGDLGNGKTAALLKIALWCMRNREKVYWKSAIEHFSLFNLHENVKDYREDQEVERAKMAKADHLFIDDLAAEKVPKDNPGANSNILKALLDLPQTIWISSNSFLMGKETDAYIRRQREKGQDVSKMQYLNDLYEPAPMDRLITGQTRYEIFEGGSMR